MLKEVAATRYVTPLWEGGSLPGLVEADDLGTYVMKFTGAGQGRRTLVAEVISAGIARRLGLRVPDVVRMELDPVIGLGEPDQEVQELLKASGGANFGMDFLPGSIGYDPLAYAVSARESGRIVWFDALINNVDRSWRNPNLLVWHGDLWLIDHGASMIWQHNWPTAAKAALRPYDASDHVLASFGPDIGAAQEELGPRVTEEALRECVAEVPGEWLCEEPGFDSVEEVRAAHVRTLAARLEGLGERITIGERSGDGPSRAPGWLTGRTGDPPGSGDGRASASGDPKGGRA
ncbi:DUF4996 domain-containing protein [Streptomyces sp. P38-E01]|uniref:DUF4996 domain-containing protein n=1 Tax=Streptomyces tardus TaxID=2780544 RepID=A0A949NAP4_9ACTN|nr:HipA family kinase [Streptomyces tardus]MBU7600078.1 DUF4996 domain-containing protein [Streptomyces tardus]